MRTAREFPSFLVLLPLPPVILGPGERVGAGVGAGLRTSSLHGSGGVSVRGKWNPVWH